MLQKSDNQKTILFGGWNEDIGLTNETWIFDSQNNQWPKVFPTITPENRQSYAMYYDPVFKKVILFGGYRNLLPPFNDTWEHNYSNNTWPELYPISSPSGRYGAKMV